MTEEDKAKIIGKASLARKEENQNIEHLKTEAENYADILRTVAGALEAGLLCSCKNGKLQFAKKQPGIIMFDSVMEYPTAENICDVLKKLDESEKELAKVEAELKKYGIIL